MATKLEELEVTSVDFVDRGANPDAHITLFKRDTAEGEEPAADEPQQKPGVWKRFLDAIGKWAGISQDEIDAAAEEIEKAGKPDPVTDDVESGSTKDTAPGSETPEEEAGTDQDVKKSEAKGEKEPMVDVSKMTPEERKVYEDIVKRYGTDEDAAGEASGIAKADGQSAEGKAAEATAAAPAQSAGTEDVAKSGEDTEDIYKGLHPLVAAELKALRKRADEEDERALTEVAKKYGIIGKKPEELIPVLKALKAAGGTAYDDMIGVLDASVEAVNKSGVFAEIGKSGGYGAIGSVAGNAAEAKVAAIAKGIMQEDPAVTPAQALARAWESNPELWEEYEREAGF